MNIEIREKIIKNCERMVIKVGTRLLTDTSRIPVLIYQIAKLREKGFKVILVSSGAVGIGMKTLGMDKRPARLSMKQALAAIGQNKLMSLYEKECAKYGFHSAQLLLTADDLRNRERHLNVLNCINSLWSENILPIVNENDSVSIDALKFGDNDILAGLLASMTRSELTVILTTVGGLHDVENGELGERISVVEKINNDIRGLASGTDDSAFSIGGMISKINAAEVTTSAGEYLWIADGRVENILEKITNCEDVGTVFLPGKRKQMQSRKRWLGFFSQAKGKLIIDDGAVKALYQKGRSLLPSGVTSVEGTFKRGDAVEICSANGEVVARGLINYNSAESTQIAGKQSSEISSILKQPADDELIHRDNLVVIEK